MCSLEGEMMKLKINHARKCMKNNRLSLAILIREVELSSNVYNIQKSYEIFSSVNKYIREKR